MKKVFLTGKPGVGKTTAVKKLIEVIPYEVAGFYTEEIREKGERVGFRLITTWGESFVFAHVDIEGPKVSKYGVDTKVLERVIDHLALPNQEILLIDEIGKMELLSGKFVRWMEKVLTSNKKIIGTVPIRSKHPLVEKIRRTYPVWEVTPTNREAIPFKILDYIK